MAGTFKITDEGTLADYLGVKIRKDDQGKMTLTQGHMIESILSDLGLDDKTDKPKETPAMPSKLLTRETNCCLGDVGSRVRISEANVGK